MTAIPIRLRGETIPMTTELLDKYNVQGPRYTSYPTAPEWSESVRAPEYEAACARANAGDARSRSTSTSRSATSSAGSAAAS